MRRSIASAALLASVFLLTAAVWPLICDAQSPPVNYTQTGTFTNVGSYVLGLAVDSLGQLYGANSMANAIQVLYPNGTQKVAYTDRNSFVQPSDVAVDAAGLIYVSDGFNHRIVVLFPNGTQRSVISTGELDTVGVAVDALSNVYVAGVPYDPYSGVVSGASIARVYYINGTTANITNSAHGGFVNPHGVAVDSQGSVYVTDFGTNALYVFYANGVQKFNITGLNHPQAVALNAQGDIFVCIQNSNTVQVFYSNGTLKQTISGFGIQSPYNIAVAANGVLYVGNYGTGGLSPVEVLTPVRVTSAVSSSTSPPSGRQYSDAPMSSSAVSSSASVSSSVTSAPATSAYTPPPVVVPPGVVSNGSSFGLSSSSNSSSTNTTASPSRSAYPGLACLTSNANTTVAYAASGSGQIYIYSLVNPPAVVQAVSTVAAAAYVDCVAHPTLPLLYLLNFQAELLVYNAANDSFSSVASFPSALYLQALAIDFVHGEAVVVSSDGELFYPIAVNVSSGGSGSVNQSFTSCTTNSSLAFTALAYSPDGNTLYLAQGNTIYSTPSPAGVPSNATQLTNITSSDVLSYPTSLLVSGRGAGQTLYVKGGAPPSFAGLGGQRRRRLLSTSGSGRRLLATSSGLQTISSVDLTQPTPVLQVLLNTTAQLPPGLILTNPNTTSQVAPTGVSSLIFSTPDSTAFITLVNSTAPAVITVATTSLSSSTDASAFADPHFVGFWQQHIDCRRTRRVGCTPCCRTADVSIMA